MSYITDITKFQKWWLREGDISADDVKFLVSLNIRVHVERPTHTFNSVVSSNKPITIAGTPRIEFTTTTEKQETMLKLKYGDDVLLMSREWYT